MSDVTVAQTRKTKSWKNTLIFVLFILILISVGANYLLIIDYIENQKKIEKLEADVRNWESMFRHFYFYADRDWPEAEHYAVGILIKAFSAKLAEEQGWSAKDQLDWETDPDKGEAYIKEILK